jgi:hypothetical protein
VNTHKNEVLMEEELEELPTRVFGNKSPKLASRMVTSSSEETLTDGTDGQVTGVGVAVLVTEHGTPETDLGTPSTEQSPTSSSSSTFGPPISRSSSPAPTLATLNPPSCPICLELFESGDTLRTLKCGHELHTSCIDPWLLERSGRCPVCRGDNRSAGRIEAERRQEEEAAERESEVPLPVAENGPDPVPPTVVQPVSRVRGLFRNRWGSGAADEENGGQR